MYNNYGFVLKWEELDSELQEQKIDEYITFNYNNSDYTNKKGEHDRSLEEILEDPQEREYAKSGISARFPVYF